MTPDSGICLGWLIAGALVLHNRVMEEVRFYFNRKLLTLEMVLSIVQVVCGFLLLLFPLTTSLGNPPMERFPGLVFFLLGAYSFWGISHPYFLKRPAVALTKEGIEINTRRESPGFLPWAKVLPETRWDGYRLVLTLEKETAYKYGNPDIPVRRLAGNRDEIASRVRAYMTAAHAAQPPQSQESLP